MATTLNTMYPPQVETFMPSFRYDQPAKIWFNISSYNQEMIDIIQYIHISMVNQNNNTNVFAGVGNNTFPQYYPVAFNSNKNNNSSSNKMGYDPNKKMYWVIIPPQVLKTQPYYNVRQYYKVQLRFDLTGGNANFPPYSNEYSDPTTFFYWDDDSNYGANALKLASYTNYNNDNFSEWSTGTLIKPILIPTLALENFNTSVNPSTNIQIVGSLKFNPADGDDNQSNDNTEWLSWYQIKINDIYDSGKIYTDYNYNLNYKIDLYNLKIDSNYDMQIIYETNNGFNNTETFSIDIVGYDDRKTVLECTPIPNENDGTIVLNITNLDYQDDYLIIRRSSHYSDFTHWDLIGTYKIQQNNSLKIVDNTIESMTGYKYQLQRLHKDNDNNILYEPIETDIWYCDFYGAFFSDKYKILRIMFDFQISNRNNAANRTKIDTLGGQYPIFTQNSKLKYHTYSITGRISTEDNGELFLPNKEDIFGSEYYNYRYTYTKNNNRQDLQEPSALDMPKKDNHTVECQKVQPHNDWLYEREYRNAVEEWLNNGKPKLFRSMTEGNMIVILDNISLSPETALGGRLYNFSATMYEVEDSKNFDSIVSLGLFEVQNDE